jgi:hypothetical protein
MIKKRRGEKCFAPTFPIWMFFSYLSFGITPAQAAKELLEQRGDARMMA